MGNKEGKFKKIFEEIDTSGDCKVSLDELINFLGEKNVFLFSSQALKLWVLSQAESIYNQYHELGSSSRAV